jgi:hypothetical protein
MEENDNKLFSGLPCSILLSLFPKGRIIAQRIEGQIAPIALMHSTNVGLHLVPIHDLPVCHVASCSLFPKGRIIAQRIVGQFAPIALIHSTTVGPFAI